MDYAYYEALRARVDAMKAAGMSDDEIDAMLDAEGSGLEQEARASRRAVGLPEELPRHADGRIDFDAVSLHFQQRARNQQKWEANPDGLSGRLVRGYRHWRTKR
jgi:hypothetical protein